MTGSSESKGSIGYYRKKAIEISAEFEPPIFYRDMSKEMEASGRLISMDEGADHARRVAMERCGALGHGYSHAEKVAVEAGAIVYSELGFGERSDTLAAYAAISGFLHDIRRGEKEHPALAAVEVPAIMAGRVDGRAIEIISFAIRNHEAFRDREEVDDVDFMICANALYDADKFRWGPDNFTYTIWDMAESMGVDAHAVMGYYERGIGGILRIKDTFRTSTGRKYGPGFIEAGMAIGERLQRLYNSTS